MQQNKQQQLLAKKGKEIKKMLLGSHGERVQVHEFETFLSNNFWQGKPITLIPDYESDALKVHIKNTGSDEDREIHNVGDGIQSIIINTFPLFQYGVHVRADNKDGKPLVLFIEEPEMMMHPSMQRVLVETFMQKNDFPNLQVYLTTHSNHFLIYCMTILTMSPFFLFKMTHKTLR